MSRRGGSLLLSGERELDLGYDTVQHRSASTADRQGHGRSIDQDDGDPLLLDVKGDLVDDSGDPGGLVTQQGVGAVDAFLDASVAMREEERRKRQTLGTDRWSEVVGERACSSSPKDALNNSRIRSRG